MMSKTPSRTTTGAPLGRNVALAVVGSVAAIAAIVLFAGDVRDSGAARFLSATLSSSKGFACPTPAKTARLFQTEKDRAGVNLEQWSPGTGRFSGSSMPPAEIGDFVVWELIPGIYEVGQDAYRNMFDALPQTATFAQVGNEGQRMYSLNKVMCDICNTTYKDGSIKTIGWFGTPPNPGPRDCNEKPVWKTRKCGPFSDSQVASEQAEVQRRLESETSPTLEGSAVQSAMVSPNVHMMRMQGHIVGMGGSGAWTELYRDATTGVVSTIGNFVFDDDLEKTLIGVCNHSPHAIYDTDKQEHVGVSLCVGPIPYTPLTNKIKVWTVPEYVPSSKRGPGGTKVSRKVFAEISTNRLFDLHSFGVSEKFVTIFESSPMFESSTLLAHKFIFKDLQMLQVMCDWQDEHANPAMTVLHISRETGEWKRFTVDGAVGKVEHVAGAYDLADGSTVVNLMAEVPGNGAAFPVAMELSRLFYHTSESAALLNQHLFRCTIPAGSEAHAKAECRDLAPDMHFGPFIVMDPRRYKKPYRYLWLVYPNMSSSLGMSDGLVKFDLQEERVVASSYSTFPPGRYVVNEPRYIPRQSTGHAEDDAMLVVSMHDTEADRSMQVVFDAADLEVVGSWSYGDPEDAASGGRMRVGFHGMHCPTGSDQPCLRL